MMIVFRMRTIFTLICVDVYELDERVYLKQSLIACPVICHVTQSPKHDVYICHIAYQFHSASCNFSLSLIFCLFLSLFLLLSPFINYVVLVILTDCSSRTSSTTGPAELMGIAIMITAIARSFTMRDKRTGRGMHERNHKGGGVNIEVVEIHSAHQTF